MDKAALQYRFGDFVFDVGQQRLLRDGVSDPIALSGKTYDALKYLVEHPGVALSKDELLLALWPGVVVEENSLTQVISSLRQLLGEIPGQNLYIATLPRKGYRFVALVTACRGDPQPPLLRADAIPSMDTHAPQLPPVPSVTFGDPRFRPWAWLICSAVIGVAAVTGRIYWRGTEASQHIRSLAILPFRPLVASDRDESLELGMTDSLIALLGQRSGHEVAPLSSVRRMGGADQDPIDAGRRLHVDAVLDGSLQRRGDRLHVNARLLRVRDAKQIWSQTFDETFTSIFEVQDKIAARIASAMTLQSLDAPSARALHGTENAEAYSLFAAGRFAYFRLTEPSLLQGIDAFEQAIVLDPRYALAYSGLADCYSLLAVLGMRDPRAMFPQARAAVDKALELDPQLAAAYVARAQIRAIFNHDRPGALEDLNYATRLDPQYAAAYFYRGLLYGSRGEFERSQSEFDQAQSIEPYVLARPAAAALQLMYARRYDEAVSRLRHIVQLDDRFDLARGFLIRVYLAKGDAEAALAELQGRDLHAQGSYGFLASALAVAGRVDDARAELNRVVALSKKQYIPAYDIAMAYAAMRNTDATMRWLDAAYEDRSTLLDSMHLEPLLEFLQGDPRFIAFIRRTEPDAWWAHSR